MAFDLWLMSQTEVGEIRGNSESYKRVLQPCRTKRTPIKLENALGVARLLRGYAQAVLENVCTANERDISHSGGGTPGRG